MQMLSAMTNRSSSAPSATWTTAPLERVLAASAALDPADVDRVRQGVDGGETTHAFGTSLDEDLRRTHARLITRGWVARGGVLADGRRQIVCLHLAGDLLTKTGGAGADVTVWALTEAATVDASRFWRTVEEAPPPGSALGPAWRRVRDAERARLIHQIIRLRLDEQHGPEQGRL